MEVHRLYKLRVDVFVHEQRCPYPEIDDIDARETTVHIRAVDGDELLGTARIFPAGGYMQFGRFALHPRARGTGLGADIMQAALELARRQGHPTVFLEAQSPLVGYYRGFGFEVCGEEFMDEGIPHTPMIRRG